MPSPDNWDANNDNWGYSDVRFISSPTSLLIAPLYNTLLARPPATLNLVSGRISTWRYPQGLLQGIQYLFRNQAPLGSSNLNDGYAVYLWKDRAKLFKRVGGVQTELKDNPVAEWPYNEWLLTRVTWWSDVGVDCQRSLSIRVEHWIDDAWVELVTWAEAPDLWYDTGIARCGINTVSWIDNTLIEGPVI